MNSTTSKYITKVKVLRKQSECLFKDVVCGCKSQGKCLTENNHIIAKSYLKRISEKNRVMAFNWEERDYYNNEYKLLEKKIEKVNTYKVLCGEHDKFLFSEIENGKPFCCSAQQNFQFALRAFLFSHSHSLIKEDHHFNNLVTKIGNKVSSANLDKNKLLLQNLKEMVLNQKWDGIKSEVIKIDRKINFISCFYIKPFFDIDFPFILTSGEVAINIFPDDNKAIILISYLENSPKTIVNYCKRLKEYSKKNEDRFIQYINKLVISCDPCIALNPLYWNSKTQDSKDSFYECAAFFKKCKSISRVIKNSFKLHYYNCRCNLFE